MLDRLMRGMNGDFADDQHLYRGRGADELHFRGWAVLWNFTEGSEPSPGIGCRRYP